MSIISSTETGKKLVWELNLERKSKRIISMLDCIEGGSEYVLMKYTFPYFFTSRYSGERKIGIGNGELEFYKEDYITEQDVKTKILERFKEDLEEPFELQDINWEFVKIQYRILVYFHQQKAVLEQ